MYISDLEGSPSLEVVNLVLQKLSRGEKITSLAIGEPLYKTPDKIMEIAYESMRNGDTHYTSSYGIPEVREAIAEKVRRKNGIKASVDNTIFITSKQSIFATFMALAGKRSRILLPNPGYFFSEPAEIAGFQLSYYRMKSDLSPDVDDLLSKLDSNVAAVLVNSPSNPTGKVMDREDLQAIYEAARKHGAKIISDEAYEDLVYEKKHFSIGSLENSPDTVISIFSLSKSYSMTGWRSGYTVADQKTVSNISKVIEHTYTCSPPFIQKASAYALKYGDKFIEEFRKDFRKKRDTVARRIGEIPTLSLGPIEGAFYAFPSYTKKVKSTVLARNYWKSMELLFSRALPLVQQGKGIFVSLSPGLRNRSTMVWTK